MKISVIIPCAIQHINLLNNNIKSIIEQLNKNDEIIISISEYNIKYEPIVKSLNATIILHKEKKTCGENRQACVNVATGDIIVSHDADDDMHPQKISIIKHLFDKYPNLNHLQHTWLSHEKNRECFKKIAPIGAFETINPDNIQIIPWNLSQVIESGFVLASGHQSFRKKVLEKVSWTDKKRGSDDKFNRSVNKEYGGCYIIKYHLTRYNQYLTTLNVDEFIKSIYSNISII